MTIQRSTNEAYLLAFTFDLTTSLCIPLLTDVVLQGIIGPSVALSAGAIGFLSNRAGNYPTYWILKKLGYEENMVNPIAATVGLIFGITLQMLYLIHDLTLGKAILFSVTSLIIGGIIVVIIETANAHFQWYQSTGLSDPSMQSVLMEVPF